MTTDQQMVLKIKKLESKRNAEGIIKLLKKLAGESKKEAERVLINICDSSQVESLIKLLKLKGKDWFPRESAAIILGKLKDSRAVQPLIDALNDEVANVRDMAAKSLGILKDPRAVEPLIDGLQRDFRKLGKEAAEAVGELNDLRAVDVLIKTLEKSDWMVQEKVIIALGKLGDPKALVPILRLKNDPLEKIRKLADEVGIKLARIEREREKSQK